MSGRRGKEYLDKEANIWLKYDAGPGFRYYNAWAEPISVGQKYKMKEHEGECCEHYVIVEVQWNQDWLQYGLVTKEGKWLSGLGIISGLTPYKDWFSK